MLDTFLSFLGHGGFKLLIVGVLFMSQFITARAKIAKKREAELRSGKPSEELGAPASLSVSATQSPMAAAPIFAAPGKTAPAKNSAAMAPLSSSAPGSGAISGSPWSNMDAFDGQKL